MRACGGYDNGHEKPETLHVGLTEREILVEQMPCPMHIIKIVIVFNKIKNRIKPTPNEKNLTQDIPDNF